MKSKTILSKQVAAWQRIRDEIKQVAKKEKEKRLNEEGKTQSPT
jgi:hypothetical protein